MTGSSFFGIRPGVQKRGQELIGSSGQSLVAIPEKNGKRQIPGMMLQSAYVVRTKCMNTLRSDYMYDLDVQPAELGDLVGGFLNNP